ncbi:MAG: hypothetical protein ACRBBU_08300 [Pseudooceanicola sp.]
MDTGHSEMGATWLEQEVELITLQLRDLKAEMARLQARARDGDLSAANEAGPILRDVRTFLKNASETEAKLAEFKRREQGGTGQHVLNLDDARASIRCRLDRLRRCQHPG